MFFAFSKFNWFHMDYFGLGTFWERGSVTWAVGRIGPDHHGLSLDAPQDP